MSSTSSSDQEEDGHTGSVLSITPSDVKAFDLLPEDSNRRACSSSKSNESLEISHYLTPGPRVSMTQDIPPQSQDNDTARVPSSPIVTGFATLPNPPQFPAYSNGGIQNHFHGSATAMTLNLNQPGNYSVDLRADMRFPNNWTNVAANASPHRFNNGSNGKQ